MLCAYSFSPSLLTTSSSFSWPFKSGVFQSSVPEPMSFGFLPLMLSSMFSFLSSALTPLTYGCLPHISSWGLSKEFKLSILIHTHTLLTCFSKPPSTYRLPHSIRWQFLLLSCPNKIKLLSASSPENPASTPVKMNSNSNIFLLLCSSSNSPISRLALQRSLHYIFREPTTLSTVAKMILHNYAGINFYSLQKPPRCLTHSKWKPNSLLWSYIVCTWLFFHTVSSASFCYLF